MTLPAVIEPEAFAQLTPSPNWLILDVSSEATYRNGHIAGAIWLPFQALLHGQAPVPGKLPSLDQLSQVCNFVGLTRESQVFVVDDEGGGWAGRLMWTLHQLGHQAVTYINGGMRAWYSANLPLETTINTPHSQQREYELDPRQRVSADDIMANLPHWQVWDARSLGEFTGQIAVSRRAGHIPGAIHCEWTDMMDPSRGYRIRQDAQTRLADVGLNGSKPIVTHCQSHHRSGFTYLVGKSLGWDIRAYDGSWAEWGNRDDTPIATETAS